MPAESTFALGTADALVVVAYIAVTTLLGIALGRGQVDNRDYFLGGHRLPTWALLISIVATETSTVTFLSVPGLAYAKGGNFTFLQMALGYIVGRLVIVAVLLPAYFRGEMLTAYQVLEQRFGVKTRRLASLVFLVTRNLADGLRLFLAALALNIAIGVDLVTCVIVTTIATGIYASVGGVRSVVWNDCIQFGVYMLGALAAVGVLVNHLPGGWGQLAEFAESTGRAQVFDFDWSLTKKSTTFWSGLIGGAFLTLATHGADQMIVQRYLCAKNQRSAGWALALSGFVVFAQFALFLLIGVGLACFYSTVQTTHAPIARDSAFIIFVVENMGTGFKGLILAAVLAATMSNLSSSINSSASSMMSDWLGPWLVGVSDRSTLRLARFLTLVSAGIHAGVAIAAYKLSVTESTVTLVLSIAGFSTGLVLGLFGLGLIAGKTSEAVALTAFGCGTLVTCYVAFFTPIAWYWYTLVGSVTIVAIGLALHAMVGPNEEIPTAA